MAGFDKKMICVVGQIALALLSTSMARAQTEEAVFDFETSLEDWQPQWAIDSPTGTPGMVSHTTERGYQDGASLHLDMGDGFGDDGTLWIEKSFSVPTGPTDVSLSFHLFNEFQSDFNNFQVKAAIATDDPESQGDFVTIGVTDTAEGWVPFTYEETINSATGEIWVALGVRVAWETHRDYWIDHVTVSTTAIPEPSSSALAILMLVAVAGYRKWRS